jgi:hypothetical protein
MLGGGGEAVGANAALAGATPGSGGGINGGFMAGGAGLYRLVRTGGIRLAGSCCMMAG